MAYNRDAFLLDACIGKVPVAAIPKCGQHSLQEHKICMIPLKNIKNHPLRIAFIRPYLDRWLSAYHFFCQSKYKLDGDRVRTYENFVDRALESDDEHIVQQVEFLGDGLFNRLFKLDDMDTVLGGLLGCSIARENVSPARSTEQIVADANDKHASKMADASEHGDQQGNHPQDQSQSSAPQTAQAATNLDADKTSEAAPVNNKPAD